MSPAPTPPLEHPRTASRRSAVQARVRWGADSVLREHHLDQGAPYRLRVDAKSAELDPSMEGSAISVAIPEGGRLRIVVPASAAVAVVHGDVRKDLDALAAAGRLEERGPAREPSFLLEEGETAELCIGGVVHELSLVELPEPSRPAFRAPLLVLASMLVSALLVSLVTVRGHRPTSRAGGSELPNLQDRAIAALIRERARQPVLPAIRHHAVLAMPSASPTSPSTPSTPTSASPELPAPPTIPNALSASQASRSVESTSATAAPPPEPEPEPEVDESPAPTAEELAELAALEARERMLRRMRRQVTHLGDCYQELGLSPGDGAPPDPADRARLAECVARRQRLAEASEAGPSTPHGVVEWDVVVEGRTGTAVYQGGRIAVPLSR